MANQSQKALKKAIENKREDEHINNPMLSNPTADPMAEVTKITNNGCWLRVFSKEYFQKKKLGNKPKDYFLSFEMYPHFLGASEAEIKQVAIFYSMLEWAALDVHMGIDDIERVKLKRGTYYGFTPKQLERLKKYNDKQVATGGKPWLHDRLLDFEYWREINKYESSASPSIKR